MAAATVTPRTILAPRPRTRAHRIGGFFHYIKRNPLLGIGLAMFLALVLFSTVGLLFIDRQTDPYPLAGPASG
jgi:peptide/nickel transport system permease protein